MKAAYLFLRIAGFTLVVFTLTGCVTTPSKVDHRARFYESTSADVVIQFNRWDTIHLLRPDTREGGFLPILGRADLEKELQSRRTEHRLAVVVLGFLFPQDIEAQYAREWDALLSAQGFERVVILRAGMGKSIDGLLVVHDSGIGGIREPSTVAKAKPGSSTISSSVGANASNPPSR